MSGTEQSTDTQVDMSEDLDAFSADFYGQKQAEPTETKVEAEQETDEAGEVEEEVQDLELEDELPAEKPKKQTVQDRINELVKQREDVKRDSDQRIEALRREFEEKIARLAPVQKPAEEASEPLPTDTKADGTPKYELGEFDPQYIRDLTRHTLEIESAKATQKAEAEYKQRQANETQLALQNDWNSRVEVAKTSYPDLIEKGQELLNGFTNLPIEYSNYLSNVLMSMDKGPDVLYYLSNNPQEAAQIVNSGAQKATLALGRIEAKFLEADAQKVVAKPKISKAPTPPTDRARGTNGAFISVAPDTDDLDAFSREFFKKK